MTQLTEEEANKILKKLIVLRNKCKKNKEIIAEYNKYEAYCAETFDYLVVARTSRYKQFANYQDLQQDGRMALLLALRNFDLRKGSWFWWSNQYIKTKISRAANCHSIIKIPMQKARFMQPHKVSSMPKMVFEGPSAMDIIKEKEIIQEVTEAIEKLPEEQKKIIKLNGIKSYSISQISRELKMSRPHCVKLLNEAKKNLKETLSLSA